MPTTHDIVQRPPKWAEAVSDLWIWSDLFCDHPTPFELFCDLIGYSGEQFGMTFYMPGRCDAPPHVAMARLIDNTLGVRELELLGRALVEYAERPLEVKAWVRLLTTSIDEDTDDIDPADDERCACGHGRVMDHIPGEVYPACLAIVGSGFGSDYCPCEHYTPAGEA